MCTAVEQSVRFIRLGYSNTSKPASLLSFSHVHEQYMQQVSLKIFCCDIVIYSSIANIKTTACCRLHKQFVFSRYQVCYTVDCSVHQLWFLQIPHLMGEAREKGREEKSDEREGINMLPYIIRLHLNTLLTKLCISQNTNYHCGYITLHGCMAPLSILHVKFVAFPTLINSRDSPSGIGLVPVLIILRPQKYFS